MFIIRSSAEDNSGSLFIVQNNTGDDSGSVSLVQTSTGGDSQTLFVVQSNTDEHDRRAQRAEEPDEPTSRRARPGHKKSKAAVLKRPFPIKALIKKLLISDSAAARRLLSFGTKFVHSAT